MDVIISRVLQGNSLETAKLMALSDKYSLNTVHTCISVKFTRVVFVYLGGLIR